MNTRYGLLGRSTALAENSTTQEEGGEGSPTQEGNWHYRPRGGGSTATLLCLCLFSGADAFSWLVLLSSPPSLVWCRLPLWVVLSSPPRLFCVVLPASSLKTQDTQEQTRKEIPQGKMGKQHHPKEEGNTIQEDEQTKKHHPERARGKRHHTNEGGGKLENNKKTRNKDKIKQKEAAQPKRREKEQHPRGATRTTPTKEEKPTPFKKRGKEGLSLLFFLLFSIPCRELSNRISTTEKSQISNKLLAFSSTSYLVFDIGRKRLRTK